jgi:hypothetical protein
MLTELIVSWSQRRSETLKKVNVGFHDDIGIYGYFHKFRVFVKATLLSLAHIAPLYFAACVWCIELCLTGL